MFVLSQATVFATVGGESDPFGVRHSTFSQAARDGCALGALSASSNPSTTGSYTVSDASPPAKVDRVALSRALSGRRHPCLDALAKEADACGVKLQFSA